MQLTCSILVTISLDPLADPTTSPATPPEPDRPLIDTAFELIKVLARKRFPWLEDEAAVMRYAAERSQADAAEEKAREDAVLTG